MHKRPISVAKLRKVPPQFSWIAHRLGRERSIDRLSHPACALYLFLLTVADAQGLSFYSDRALCQRLSLTALSLPRARQELLREGLVAYEPPLYQVLALDAPPVPLPPVSPPASAARLSAADTPMALKDIFQRIAETLA